ncbi:hypothetical protein JW960_16065 [candidate division KSB1 bacterium]|nr:hypothetical protein [candidate division KSB1 bacterium]
MVVTFVFERLFTLNKAKGKGSLIKFLNAVKKEIVQGNIDAAIGVCDSQHGSGANILRAGLERYKILKLEKQQLSRKEVMEEVHHSIEDSMMLGKCLCWKRISLRCRQLPQSPRWLACSGQPSA